VYVGSAGIVSVSVVGSSRLSIGFVSSSAIRSRNLLTAHLCPGINFSSQL